MVREDENKQRNVEQNSQTKVQGAEKDQNPTTNEQSHPRPLDKTEGRMNNGEIGGGIGDKDESNDR